MQFHIGVLLTLSGLILLHSTIAQSIQKSLETFSYKLYQKVLEDTKTDFVLSPISVQTCLTMAYLGARNQTAIEMKRALEITENNDQIATEFRALLTPLQNESSILKMANKIYVSDTFKIKEAFNAILNRNFFTTVDGVDFSDSEEAAKTINSYVASKTNNTITDLVPSNKLNKHTTLVLINAVYFKGVWQESFDELETRKRIFFTGANSRILVDTMQLISDKLKYAEIPEHNARLIGIDYKGDYSLNILIPNHRTGLAKLEERITNIDLNSFEKRLQPKWIRLLMPKFKTKFKISLKTQLKKLGMEVAFDTFADFSDIGNRVGHIDDVLHQATISFGEIGTEASAASAVIFHYPYGAFIAPYRTPPDVRLEHPFIYYLTDSGRSKVFFVGRYAGGS